MEEKKKGSNNRSTSVKASVARWFTVFMLLIFAGCMVSTMLIALSNYLLKHYSVSFVWLAPMNVLSMFGVFLIEAILVYKNIYKLLRAIHTVSEGDFSDRAKIQFKANELLAPAFNQFNGMVDELQSNKILKEDFINNFSHEFKTPIASIQGFAQVLLDSSRPVEAALSEDEKRQYLQIIADESGRLADLSRNTLLLSKIESERIVTDKTDFRLDEQIKRCAIILAREWEKKHISVNLEQLPSLSYYGSEELLQEVWINLLGNAIKFTPDGGTVSVSGSDMRRGQERALCVTVTDTGPGMSKEVQQHIFEQYYQGDRSHAGQGHGLGLAIVKRIVELSGGSVQVQSAVGQGSAFIVILPDSASR